MAPTTRADSWAALALVGLAAVGPGRRRRLGR
jgi:MYXO-CTERM domain-containing protein